MNLIVISGPEATGKTFIGKSIAKTTGYQYVSKDIIKESLFDKLKHSTWDYTWYEEKAKQELFRQINEQVKNNVDIVVESNFISKDQERLQACLLPDTTVREVFCYSKGMTTLKRFIARNESGQRHRGHHDRRWYPKVLIEDLLQNIGIHWPSKPFGLDGSFLEIDTTDLAKLDIQAIIRTLGIK